MIIRTDENGYEDFDGFEEVTVPYKDYEFLEQKYYELVDLIDDIKSTLNEEKTDVKIVKALIEDFEG
jgi:hypothetical protein